MNFAYNALPIHPFQCSPELFSRLLLFFIQFIYIYLVLSPRYSRYSTRFYEIIGEVWSVYHAVLFPVGSLKSMYRIGTGSPI